MGSLDPDVDMKQESDASEDVEDEIGSKTAMEEYRGSANLLDLSDDVLLYILKNLSAHDLKALGFTCVRLGALVVDHTLWVDVDARDVPHGCKRVRWMLMRVLGPHTRSLRLTGYAEQATGCLGFVTRYDREDSDDDGPEEERYLCEGSRLYKLIQPQAPRCDNRFPFWLNALPAATAPSQPLSTNRPTQYAIRQTPAGLIVGPSYPCTPSAGPSNQPTATEPSTQPSVSASKPAVAAPKPAVAASKPAVAGPLKQTGSQPQLTSDRPLPSRGGSSEVLAAGSQSWQVTSLSQPSTSEPVPSTSKQHASTSQSTQASSSHLSDPAEPSTSASESQPSTSGSQASSTADSAAGPSQAAGTSQASRNRRRMFMPSPQPYSTSNTTCPGPQLTFTHTGLRALSIMCPNLTTLELDYCVIDCQTTSIAQFPKTLLRLSLKGTKCYNMESKTFLFKIQDHLDVLEDIDVSFCSWIEPACMLPLSKISNLLRLSMRECPKLTEFVAYASLATRYGFKKLKVLDLRASPVGDSEVAALGWLPSLEELYLSPSPKTPPIEEHAHFKQDSLPEFKELNDWEETDPDYFKISEEQEDEWTRDEESAQGIRNRFYNCEDPPACTTLERMMAELHPLNLSAIRDQLSSGDNDIAYASSEQHSEAIRNFLARQNNPQLPPGRSLVLRNVDQDIDSMIARQLYATRQHVLGQRNLNQRPVGQGQDAPPNVRRRRSSDQQPAGQGPDAAPKVRRRKSSDQQPGPDAKPKMRRPGSSDQQPAGQGQDASQKMKRPESSDQQPAGQGQDESQKMKGPGSSAQQPAGQGQEASQKMKRPESSDQQPDGQGRDAKPKTRRPSSSDQQSGGQGPNETSKVQKPRSTDQQSGGQGPDETPKVQKPRSTDQQSGGQGPDETPKVQKPRSTDQQSGGQGPDETPKKRTPRSTDQQPGGQGPDETPKVRRPRSTDRQSGGQGPDETPKVRRPRSTDRQSGGQGQDETPKVQTPRSTDQQSGQDEVPKVRPTSSDQQPVGQEPDATKMRRRKSSDQQPDTSGNADKPGTSGKKRKSDKDDGSSDDDNTPTKVTATMRTIATQTGCSKRNGKGSDSSKKTKMVRTPRRVVEITFGERITHAQLPRLMSEAPANNNTVQDNNQGSAGPSVQPMDVEQRPSNDIQNPVHPEAVAGHSLEPDPMEFDRYVRDMRRLIIAAHSAAMNLATQAELGNQAGRAQAASDNTAQARHTENETDKTKNETEQKNKKDMDVDEKSITDNPDSNPDTAGPSTSEQSNNVRVYTRNYVYYSRRKVRDPDNRSEAGNQAGSSSSNENGGNTRATENEAEKPANEAEEAANEAEEDNATRDAGNQTRNLYNGVPGIDDVPLTPEQEERNRILYENRAHNLLDDQSLHLSNMGNLDHAARVVIDAFAQTENRQRPARDAERQRLYQFRQYRRPIVIEEFINSIGNEARNQRPMPRGVLFAGLIPARLDHSALISDSSIRRFGRATGENIVYLGGGPAPARGVARPDRSNLRILSVTGFRHITDASLTHLVSAAPHLQTLDLTGTSVSARAVHNFRVMRPDVNLITDHPEDNLGLD